MALSAQAREYLIVGLANKKIGNEIADAIDAAGSVAPSEIALASGELLVGQSTGLAGAKALSGDATIATSGALTVANSAVIGKVLTGYVSGAGTVAATDTILQAINKLNGNTAAKLTASQAANQADSVAVDTAAMVVDFNALLAKLQAAGIMA